MGGLSIIKNLQPGYVIELLYMISIISIFFGIFIITTKNPIFSVLFLIGLFGAISIYLVLIGLEFIGISYILVYVGAISILFLFILMLINIRVSELITEERNSVFLALLAVLSFNVPINKVVPYNMLAFHINYDYIFPNINSMLKVSTEELANLFSEVNQDKLASVHTKSWDSVLVQISQISAIGNILYTNIFMYLMATSFILLLAMVGAIVITVKRSESGDVY